LLLGIGDLGGDGDPDLVVSNQISDDISVLSNLGDGSFAPEQRYPMGDFPTEIELSDLDGDGDLDVIVVEIASTTISVRFNQGGVLGPETVLDLETTNWNVAVGDIDGNGTMDLVHILPTHYIGAFMTRCVESCIADLTGEGDLNFLDVSAFLTAFGNQDPAADFETDGNFNFLDVSAFLSAFAGGCP
jgi:hypothetical protein